MILARPWKNLGELFDLYGIDSKRGGGELFAQLVLCTWVLRGSGYHARDYAAAYRREAKISPLVHCSLMKRAAWQLLDASDDELKEMDLHPTGRNVYALADAIAAAMWEVHTAEDERMMHQLVKRMEALNVYPRGPEAAP